MVTPDFPLTLDEIFPTFFLLFLPPPHISPIHNKSPYEHGVLPYVLNAPFSMATFIARKNGVAQ